MRNLILLALLSFGLYSCSNEEVDPGTTTLDGQVSNKVETACAIIYDLKAGQNYTAGTVTVTNDLLNVYVTYQTNSIWELNEIHLYVGSKAGMPVNKNGSPKLGHFPVNVTNLYQKTFTATLPINSTWGQCFTVAAHAVVSKTDGLTTQTETAWAEGIRFTKSNWFTYSEYCLRTCIPECEFTNETAYGGATMGGGNAWWYYYVNDGTPQPIYAGKQLVDGATVQYSNGQIVLTLGDNMILDPTESESVKIQGYYTDNNPMLPAVRPASGHFAYKGSALTVPFVYYPYYIIHLDVEVENCIVPAE